MKADETKPVSMELNVLSVSKFIFSIVLAVTFAITLSAPAYAVERTPIRSTVPLEAAILFNSNYAVPSIATAPVLASPSGEVTISDYEESGIGTASANIEAPLIPPNILKEIGTVVLCVIAAAGTVVFIIKRKKQVSK